MNTIRTADLLFDRIGRLLRPLGVSAAGGLVLGLLRDHGSMSPSELGARLIVTRATVTGLLDSLEKPGFVRRLRHPTDRRSIVVEITDEGLAVLAQVRTLIHRNERAWMGTLSEAELVSYISLLHRVQDALAVIRHGRYGTGVASGDGLTGFADAATEPLNGATCSGSYLAPAGSRWLANRTIRSTLHETGGTAPGCPSARTRSPVARLATVMCAACPLAGQPSPVPRRAPRSMARRAASAPPRSRFSHATPSPPCRGWPTRPPPAAGPCLVRAASTPLPHPALRAAAEARWVASARGRATSRGASARRASAHPETVPATDRWPPEGHEPRPRGVAAR